MVVVESNVELRWTALEITLAIILVTFRPKIYSLEFPSLP